MIFYFSGTGNSEYVAKRIGVALHDEVIDLFDKIKQKDYACIESNTPVIIVAPTYAWRIPRILSNWIKQTEFKGNKDIYFVMTCGGNIGHAGKYLKQLSDFKKLSYLGCYPIKMPENYIAMFSTPTKEEALKTIEIAEDEIDNMISILKQHIPFPNPLLTLKDRLNSGIVNDVFYPVFVHAKKFRVIDTCIQCGKCVQVCPLKNIQLENGKPVWSNHCTHCMACICKCPVEAIEYGKHSVGLPRYICPK